MNLSDLILNYECDGCGLCCTKLIIECDEHDVIREPRLFELQTGSVTLESMVREDKVLHLAMCKPCKALDENKRCTIYPSRPSVCVGFLAGDGQCQELRRENGLPELKPKAAGMKGGA